MFVSSIIGKIVSLAKEKNTLKISLLSNFSSNALNALLSLIFVPVYLSYLGIEVYGLIGIFNSIQAFLWTFDLGLSPTINRELARLSDFPEKNEESRNTVRTLETISWLVSLAVTIFLLMISPIVSNYWISSNSISTSTVTQSFWLMSLTFGFQLPIAFYASGLFGLQKQFLLNSINAVFLLLRYFGSILILTFVSNTIQAFLFWQLIIVILQTITAVILLWLFVSGFSEAKFKRGILKHVYRFAVGMSLASGLGLLVSQVDKVILSRMLNLETFGYYSLAVMIAMMSLGMINGTISTSVYPVFSRAVANESEDYLKYLYHKSCQLMAVAVIPLTVFLAFFSKDILQLWIRKEGISENTAPVLTIISISIGISCLRTVPYRMQLAHGWTRLDFYGNFFGFVLLIPSIIIGAYFYGIVGGALGLLPFSLVSAFILTFLVHRRLLKGEYQKWLFTDVLIPAVVSILVLGSGKILMISFSNDFYKSIQLGCFLFFAILLTAFAVPIIRQELVEHIRQKLS